MTSSVSSSTVASLKAEGVELFRQRRYKDATKKFTVAIELDEPDCDELKAHCHNNRAAARHLDGRSPFSALIADATEAIRLKPDYGKAYANRMNYHMKGGHWSDALSDLIAACNLGAMVPDKRPTMNKCLDKLVQKERTDWEKQAVATGGEHHVRVKHEKINSWLEGFARDDGLIKDIKLYKAGGLRDEGTYSLALQLFDEKQYDEIETLISERKDDLGDREPECLLLRSMIINNQCKWVEFGKVYEKAARMVVGMPVDERSRGLRVSMHVIRMHYHWTDKTISQEWVIAADWCESCPDFYTQAYRRLISYMGCGGLARAIIRRKEAPGYCDAITVMRILAELDDAADYLTVATLNDVEETLRELGLSSFAVYKIAPMFAACGAFSKAAKLCREIAKRDNDSNAWMDLTRFCATQEEADSLVQKCLAIEPFNRNANILNAVTLIPSFVFSSNLSVETSLQAVLETCDLGDNIGILPSRRAAYIIQPSLERALSTYDADNDDLPHLFRVLALVKAKIRAAVMVGCRIPDRGLRDHPGLVPVRFRSYPRLTRLLLFTN